MAASEQERYIIKADEIEQWEGTPKTHFLNTNAQRINKSLGDLTGLTGLGFHLIEVQPGHESTEYHTHYYEDECTYVLSGTGTVDIDGELHDIGPGDFIGYRAGGLAHTMTASGTEPLRCLVAGQRLAHDVADYPRLKKRIFRNDGMRWNLVDHEHLEEPSAGKK